MKTIVALLLSAAFAIAAEMPKVKPEVTGVEWQLITIPAESATPVKFMVVDATGLTIVPQSELVNKNQFMCVGKPGRYRVLCWTGDKDGPSDMAETLLVIGDGKAPEVKPDNPVTPESALLQSLRKAYNKTDSDKVKRLAESYRQVVTSIDNNKPLTHGQVFTTAASKRNAQGVKDSDITAIRDICNQSIGVLLSNDPDNKVTDEQRKQIIAQFKTLAENLDKVTK